MASTRRWTSMLKNETSTDYTVERWTITSKNRQIDASNTLILTIFADDPNSDEQDTIVELPQFNSKSAGNKDLFVAMNFPSTPEGEIYILGSRRVQSELLTVAPVKVSTAQFDKGRALPVASNREAHYNNVVSKGQDQNITSDKILWSFLNHCWRYSLEPEFWAMTRPVGRSARPDLELPEEELEFLKTQPDAQGRSDFEREVDEAMQAAGGSRAGTGAGAGVNFSGVKTPAEARQQAEQEVHGWHARLK
eukprot:gene15729-18653_t